MSDTGETFRAMKAERVKQSSGRRDRASEDFAFVSAQAIANGFLLVRNSESHYTLRKVGGWFIEVYPGNRRIYRHPGSGAPHLSLPGNWTLADVVGAAINQKKEGI